MKFDEIVYTELLELYKGLLTPNKSEIAEMYFSCDLSLTEIAEIKNCTRQNVLDAVKSVKAELDGFEAAVGFKAYKDRLRAESANLSDADRETLKRII